MNGTRLCVVFALLLLARGLPAATEIHIASKYYSFAAHDKASIWVGMASASPKVSLDDHVQHEIVIGLTEWRLRQRYQYQAALFRCEVADHVVVLDVVIHLPHWKDKWKAPAHLQSSWDKYVRMVSDHEDIHKAYAIRTAERIDEEVSALGQAKDCEQLTHDIDKIVEKHLAQNRLDNKWFDAKERFYQKRLQWF